MKLNLPTADIFVPDGLAPDQAAQRVTHLGIGAHQDDLEFMAFQGIVQCFEKPTEWFGGVTCTNGGGSARTGQFATYSDEDMIAARREEQRKAAVIGKYGIMWQLDYPSEAAKNPADWRMTDDLRAIFSATNPRFVYTHNPADKHETHLAVTVAVIRALREMPAEQRPEKVYGCEMWRGLDWMLDAEKVVHDVSGNPSLATEINAVFESQIAGGKRYDLGVMGRRRANATFNESHGVDRTDATWFSMDLTPLIHDATLDVVDYTCGFIERFKADVRTKLQRVIGQPPQPGVSG